MNINNNKLIMNIKLMSFALLASAFATSCNNNESEELANSKVAMQFTASQEKVDASVPTAAKGTRTTLQADGFSIKWQANDAIAVFPEGKERFPDKFTAKAEGSTTSFTGTTTSATIYRALFPYNPEAKYIGGEFHANLPTEQFVEDNNMANDANITIATLTNAHPSMTGNHLNFKNTCGILKITFKYASTLSNEDKKKVKSIEVECRDDIENISGAVKIGVDGNCVSTDEIHELSQSKRMIIATKKNGEPLTDGASYYIVVPAQTMNGIIVRLKNVDEETYGVTVMNPIEFKRNKIQKLNLTVKGWKKDLEVGV